MRIYFTRHGESQANLLNEVANRGLKHGLTHAGREQAAALAERLKDLTITRIYSSPLLRAIETSVIVANRLGAEYEVVDALREYDCGIAEGRSDAEARQMVRAVFEMWVLEKRWEERIEGGECFHDIRERFVPFIEGLVSRYKDSEAGIVCVSHGGVYWTMLPLVLKNVDLALIGKHGLGHTSCVVAEWRPEGLYCVEWDGKAIAETSGSA